MRRFERKVVVVTGADRGIGLAIAERFAREGARLAIASNRAEIHVAAERLAAQGGEVFAHELDVTDASQVESFFDAVVTRFEGIDVSVHNAGVITIAPLASLEECDWDLVMDVNAKGVFLCCKAAIRCMRPARSGALINMASGQARQGFIYTPHYAASKFGVLGLTQSLAKEFADEGITVNAICPGIVETEMWDYNDRAWGALLSRDEKRYAPGELIEEWISRIPMKRAARGEEIAAAVAFLASNDARYITGQAINVDGGMAMN
ncbi:SDR family NAD(P)-dependent oxidoreductase [Halotalea alkalilenta]|uniref:SDR family oxidoreductase n=1 Tax=Halotalea alkalilenta TaxID=376489 RepID=A0A172YCM7_9GAMM|nr:SDR family oxidoreductase [Halotalea alkalilenta]ANF56755.1 SDR family oxidoreductase [Halotalea alkalilenta]